MQIQRAPPARIWLPAPCRRGLIIDRWSELRSTTAIKDTKSLGLPGMDIDWLNVCIFGWEAGSKVNVKFGKGCT